MVYIPLYTRQNSIQQVFVRDISVSTFLNTRSIDNAKLLNITFEHIGITFSFCPDLYRGSLHSVTLFMLHAEEITVTEL